jgi:hypothetical protein
MTEDDSIPVGSFHRGVGLHRGQCERRLSVVRNDVDAAFDAKAVDALMAFLCDELRAPESRLLAGARLEAIFESAVDNREARPPVDLVLVRAIAAGLASKNWRDRGYYGSDLDHGRGTPRDPDDEPIGA